MLGLVVYKDKFSFLHLLPVIFLQQYYPPLLQQLGGQKNIW